MKTFTILIFSLLMAGSLFAQEQAIKITKQTSKREIIIKENRRIKVKTINGEKVSGRFRIEGNSIIIKDKHIEFNDIAEIKRNPLLLSILTSGVLIYGGSIMAGFGVLIGVLSDSAAYWLVLPAAGMIYAGIKSPNLNKNHKKSSNRTFELITLPN